MSNFKRTQLNPFYLNGERAMVSLGPLTEKKYCPYSCAFFFFFDDFGSYVSLDLDDIINFLVVNRNKYNIIYVSGDTDSFAPPRTDKGVQLLSMISQSVECDLLFTTRAVLPDFVLNRLSEIADRQRKINKLLIAATSITRYSEEVAYLEPAPIPSPDERIQHMKNMKALGAVTMLGLRPFLPMVNVNDYIAILDKIHPFLDIALGERFYFIRNGNIQKRVFPNGIPKEIEKEIKRGQKMYFDDNQSYWDTWSSLSVERTVAEHCRKRGIIFAMHSTEALEEYRKTL